MKNIGILGWLVILGLAGGVSSTLQRFVKDDQASKNVLVTSPERKNTQHSNQKLRATPNVVEQVASIDELEKVLRNGLALKANMIDCTSLIEDFETVFVIPSRSDEEIGYLQIMEKNEVLYDAMMFAETPTPEEWTKLIQFTEASIEQAKNSNQMDAENYMFYKSMMLFAPKFMVWVGEKEVEFDLSGENLCLN